MSCIEGSGTVFQWTISAVLTAVAQLTEIGGGNKFSKPVLICSDLDSTAVPKKAGTNTDYGPIPIKGFYDPANSTHQALITDGIAGTERAAKILWNNSGSDESAFTGFLSDFENTGIVVDGLVEFSATLQVNGAITMPS